MSTIVSNQGGLMRAFFVKVKHFFKRNIYPITVSVCTVLILSIVSVSAYNSIKNVEEVPSQNIETSKPEIDDVIVDTGTGGVKDEVPEVVKPTVSTEPIVFMLPFENATISKQFADNSLLYDNTTKLWCTHQAIDFSCVEGQSVVSIYAGTIEKIESSMMNGTTIYLKVSDELTVVYKGLSSDLKVYEGEKVEKGKVIGTVTSFLSEKADGVHLHLELLKNNKLIDPTEYFSFNK